MRFPDLYIFGTSSECTTSTQTKRIVSCNHSSVIHLCISWCGLRTFQNTLYHEMHYKGDVLLCLWFKLPKTHGLILIRANFIIIEIRFLDLSNLIFAVMLIIIMTMKACCELYSKFIYECVHRSAVGGKGEHCQYSCFNHTISHRSGLGTPVASSSFLIRQSVSKLTTHIPCGKKGYRYANWELRSSIFVSEARYFHGILAVIKIPFQV
jgi:hypothetical protein